MIELYLWDDAPEKYKKLLPTTVDEMSRHTESRPPTLLAVVPEALVKNWTKDPYDGRPIAVFADRRLEKALNALDSVYDPLYVRLKSEQILVFGRD